MMTVLCWCFLGHFKTATLTSHTFHAHLLILAVCWVYWCQHKGDMNVCIVNVLCTLYCLCLQWQRTNEISYSALLTEASIYVTENCSVRESKGETHEKGRGKRESQNQTQRGRWNTGRGEWENRRVPFATVSHVVKRCWLGTQRNYSMRKSLYSVSDHYFPIYPRTPSPAMLRGHWIIY